MSLSIGLPRTRTGRFRALIARLSAWGSQRKSGAPRADIAIWPDYLLRDVGLPVERGIDRAFDRRGPMDWPMR